MVSGAQLSTTSATYRVLRELGKRSQRSWAAIRERNELLVLQRFTKTEPSPADAAANAGGVAYLAAEPMALMLRDARCLLKNWHPNVARVRHVDLVGDDLTIATELVDGVTLEDLVAIARENRKNDRDPILPYPLVARIIVDVLGGLHGLHGLRDGINAPLNVVHGELGPANIVLGKDGVARVAHVFRPRPVKITPASESLGYASPETLAGEKEQDARADLYSVGAILWEGLTGRRLFADSDPSRIAQRQREEELPRPELPGGSPFARLAEVALRALSFDPALRFRTASEMATEVRRIAGTRLAPGSAVAQTVIELAGARIRARRGELDVASGRRPTSMPPPPTTRVPSDLDLAAFAAAAARASVTPSETPAHGSIRPSADVTPAKPVPAVPPRDAGEKKFPPRAPLPKVPRTAPPKPVIPRKAPEPGAAAASPDDSAGAAKEPRGPLPSLPDAAKDALAVATAKEITVDSKSLLPPSVPPPAPMPIPPPPFPLDPPLPPLPGEAVDAIPSETDLSSVDIVAAAPIGDDVIPPDPPTTPLALEPKGLDPDATEPFAAQSASAELDARRKKLKSLVFGISAVALLLVLIAAAASVAGGGKDKDTSQASSAASTKRPTAKATARTKPSATADPPSTPAPTAEPPPAATEEPATEPSAEPAAEATSEDEPESTESDPAATAAPPRATAPSRPTGPRRTTKKSSYEPMGI